jgi:hypothetical protein
MRKSMGNFTTMYINGRNIVRSKAFHVKRKKSKAQVSQITKMTLLADVNIKFGGITDWGFVENCKGMSPYNLFVSANFNSAFDLTGEIPIISYPMLQVSKGSIPKVKTTEITIDTEGITINYETGKGLPKVSATDEIIAFARLKKGSLLITRQPRGIEETGSILISFKDENDEEVECCYLFARSEDGKKVSNSTYITSKSAV